MSQAPAQDDPRFAGLGQMNQASTWSRDFETLRIPGKTDILRDVRVWLTGLKEREVSWGNEDIHGEGGHSTINKSCLEVISRVYATLKTTIVYNLRCLVCLKTKHKVPSP